VQERKAGSLGELLDDRRAHRDVDVEHGLKKVHCQYDMLCYVMLSVCSLLGVKNPRGQSVLEMRTFNLLRFLTVSGLRAMWNKEGEEL
jgi:hypothetical protein